MSECLIRQMVCADIRQVRKLPVQLAQPVMHTLWARKLRGLLYDRSYQLLVCQCGSGVSAFAGLKFDGPEMKVNWLAADRFSLATELEAYAMGLAKEKETRTIRIDFEKLPEEAKIFYGQCGYVPDGNTLIKELWDSAS